MCTFESIPRRDFNSCRYDRRISNQQVAWLIHPCRFSLRIKLISPKSLTSLSNRRSSETSCIFHCGYLLKRSNAPLKSVSRRTSDEEEGQSSGPPLVPEETLYAEGVPNGTSKDVIELPAPPLTASDDNEHAGDVADNSFSSARSVQDATDLVAALSFGLDFNSPLQGGMKTAPTELPANKSEVDIPNVSTPPRPSVAIPIPSAATNDKQGQNGMSLTPPYHRLNSAPPLSSRRESNASSQQSAPADYIAPDGPK